MLKRCIFLAMAILLVFLIFSGCGTQVSESTPATEKSTPAPLTSYYQESIGPGASGGLSTAEVPPGGRISLHFTVKGGNNSDIMFSVKSPDGGTLDQSPTKVYYLGDYGNSSAAGGRFQFTWDNKFDNENAKVIEASYTIYGPNQ